MFEIGDKVVIDNLKKVKGQTNAPEETRGLIGVVVFTGTAKGFFYYAVKFKGHKNGPYWAYPKSQLGCQLVLDFNPEGE